MNGTFLWFINELLESLVYNLGYHQLTNLASHPSSRSFRPFLRLREAPDPATVRPEKAGQMAEVPRSKPRKRRSSRNNWFVP